MTKEPEDSGKTPGSKVIQQMAESAKDIAPIDPQLAQKLADKMAEQHQAKDNRKKDSKEQD